MPEFGEVKLHIDDHSNIFAGIPDDITVWGSHNDEVKNVPEGFKVLASSPSCGIEAVSCLTRPLFGVQYHPEVENSEYGAELFQNFLEIIKTQRA
jgi:GMP synthase (glutamine-hydrolysing)